MKLWEYVLKYDKKSGWLKWLGEQENILPELILKEGYCPGVFDCFNKTGFDKPLYPYTNEPEKCKIKDANKCINCWNREIENKNDKETNNEYELYLKLKEKYENK